MDTYGALLHWGIHNLPVPASLADLREDILNLTVFTNINSSPSIYSLFSAFKIESPMIPDGEEIPTRRVNLDLK